MFRANKGALEIRHRDNFHYPVDCDEYLLSPVPDAHLTTYGSKPVDSNDKQWQIKFAQIVLL